jgi:AsmA protein
MRWILRLVGIAASLAVLAALALFLLPAERIAVLAADRFGATTGRALTITGQVRPTIWPNLGARVEGVTVASTPWAQGGPLLTAEVLDLRVDAAGLWAGDIRVRRFEARGAQVVLERDAQGRANWVFEGLAPAAGAAPGTGGAPAGGAGAVGLDRVEIRGGSIRVIDQGAGLDLRLEGIDADLTLPDLSGPGTLAISGRKDGQGFAADLRIAQVQRFLSGEVTALTLSATAGPARVGFDGRAGFAPMAAEGRLTLSAPALAPLLAMAGQHGPEPLPPAALPLEVSGQVTLAPAGSLHLREGRIVAGAARIEAALDLTLDGQRPRLAGSVSAGALDLRPFLGGDGGGGGGTAQAGAPAAGAGGWPRTRIDASGLELLDAQIALAAGPVQTGIVDLERFAGSLSIDRARAVLEMREARLFGGSLAGELVANNRSGLSVGGDLRAADISLLPLMRQLAGYERLTGTGAMSLRFLGVGQSVDEIMRSLRGEGRIDLGRGEIIGLDLAGMIRSMDMSYMGPQNRTVFDSVSGSFGITAGVLGNEDLRLTSSVITVEGRGRVDLGARTLDYRVTPVALRDPASGREIRVPLVISGPWAEPRFRLDLEGLAEQRLQEERARLEAQAREEIARREAELRARAAQELQDRLGVTLPEGAASTREAIEQGVRQRAEEEITRGLQRLLQGSGN